MLKYRLNACLAALGFCLVFAACKVPAGTQATENKNVPSDFTANTTGTTGDSTNTADISWRRFFTDQNLINLIDTALVRNQELNITLQEIEAANNDVLFRNGPLRPLVAARLGAGVEKVGRFTSQGAGDASTEIEAGKPVPEVIADYSPNLYASWEVDIWKKLRNSKKAAVSRYLASIEGKNFVITNLVAEVANSYYELTALDNQLEIVRQNIALQQNALEVVKVQKQASKATELAVQKFQAEVLRTQSIEFDIVQDIKETENRINFLLARYPQDIPRDKAGFFGTVPASVSAGVPSQLLANRPDIRQAELELAASKLDVKVARAEFYPSLDITAMVGLQAFKPSYLVKLPESILFNAIGDLAAPLINRNAITAEFKTANARQVQAIYNYERSILNAYLEVSNHLAKIENVGKTYSLKSRQVDALSNSINIANDLFKSARADYLEVLMTQRDALEAKLELVETKKAQLNSVVNVYRDLGGGWR